MFLKVIIKMMNFILKRYNLQLELIDLINFYNNIKSFIWFSNNNYEYIEQVKVINHYYYKFNSYFHVNSNDELEMTNKNDDLNNFKNDILIKTLK